MTAPIPNMSQHKITIVTPCYNSERFLEETIQSVLSQGWENLEYIIIDGGSTDGTVDIIRKYEDRLAYWISEPDKGMYDAINKGFAKATGDIYAWINSDDLYLPETLATVAKVFERHPDIRWVTGANRYIDEMGETLRNNPVCLFHRSDIEAGLHGLCAHHIPQPCTFWRRDLWQACGPIPNRLKLAGDYWLWLQFAQWADLVSVARTFAAFRQHGQQLSNEYASYKKEVRECCRVSRWLIALRRLLRLLARRYRWDVHLLNLLQRKPGYHWIDPVDNYALKQTRKVQLPVKS